MELTVKGMHCNSCKIIITEALEDLGAKNVKVSVDEKKQIGRVAFENLDQAQAVIAIKNEGYAVI
ncbi:heavy-metal-associated domain-containing protein [Candidatus Woesearchaeota archaeon]|nr:heavy-metal-associated domain-containing protein [Candidatus Woesearchaeota archaeon]